MLENENYEDLGYKSSLCKKSRFKFSVGKIRSVDELGILVLILTEKLGSP